MENEKHLPIFESFSEMGHIDRKSDKNDRPLYRNVIGIPVRQTVLFVLFSSSGKYILEDAVDVMI